ncbi:hypothetical protein BHE74_00003904 [Ensete ventricosum]|nr:hypothetical protein GW17_00007931 [Ensete ventricosum]RWW87279.1 hypothetical protein BHE74_00003904 [Ensete ventricosum]
MQGRGILPMGLAGDNRDAKASSRRSLSVNPVGVKYFARNASKLLRIRRSFLGIEGRDLSTFVVANSNIGSSETGDAKSPLWENDVGGWSTVRKL